MRSAAGLASALQLFQLQLISIDFLNCVLFRRF